MPLFDDAVSALCYSVIRERGRPGDPAEHFPHNEVVAYVLGQHARAPWFVRVPVFALTIVFDLCGIFRRGRLFHNDRHLARVARWQAWRVSKLRPCRDLMMFYEGLTVFAWYSFRADPAEADAVSARTIHSVERMTQVNK